MIFHDKYNVIRKTSVVLLMVTNIWQYCTANLIDADNLGYSIINNNNNNQDIMFGSSCEKHFKGHLHKCMGPFTRHVHLYTSITPQNAFVKQIYIKHVCRQYKKMLHCIHTVLSNCQTEQNTEIVQNKLRKDWVSTVNQMCDIQSNKQGKITQSKTSNSKGDNMDLKSKSKQDIHASISFTKPNLPLIEDTDQKASDFPLLSTARDQHYRHQTSKSERSKGLITVISYNYDKNSVNKNPVDIEQLNLNELNLQTIVRRNKRPILVQLFYTNRDTNSLQRPSSSISDKLFSQVTDISNGSSAYKFNVALNILLFTISFFLISFLHK